MINIFIIVDVLSRHYRYRYQVNLKFQDDEKFVKLLKTTLTVFAMLLELATFNEIGKVGLTTVK